MIKVSTMTDEQLDYYVSIARGWEIKILSLTGIEEAYWIEDGRRIIEVDYYHPSIDNARAMELVIEFGIDIRHIKRAGQNDLIVASTRQQRNDFLPSVSAEDEMVAVCRAVIVSVLGEEVEGLS